MSTEEYLSVALQAALQAGNHLRHGIEREFVVETKPGKHNFVTEYDKSAEKKILDIILTRFPNHRILAEESGEIQTAKSDVTWIIDPLDGTLNFLRRIPIFCVSIGVAIQEKVVIGVIYQPITQELFFAQKGKGAFLNGGPIRISSTKKLEKAVVATGFPYNVDQNPLQCIDRFAYMQAMGLPIRRFGSAAIDLAYVAAGRFDAYWEVSLHPWDMAAGKILVEEAGGKVTHYDGSPHHVFSHETLVASNGYLHDEMLKHINEKTRWGH